MPAFPLDAIKAKVNFECFETELGCLYYRSSRQAFVVAGDPVAKNLKDKIALLDKFKAWAEDQGQPVTGYYFSQEFGRRTAGFRAHQAGVSRILDLRSFDFRGGQWQEARRAIRKAKADKLRVEEVLGAEQSKWLEPLQKIERSWLSSRTGPQIGFLLDNLSIVEGARWFVCKRNDQIQAFITLLPFGAANFYLDKMVKSPVGHRFAMDYLLCEVATRLRDENHQQLSLGLCPFVGFEPRTVFEWLLQQVQKMRFLYSARGLYNFKRKYSNKEEPRYLLIDQNYGWVRQISSLVEVTYF